MSANRIVPAHLVTGELICVACFCTESSPCPGGCSWAAIDQEAGVGLCTACAAKPIGELLEDSRLEDVSLDLN